MFQISSCLLIGDFLRHSVVLFVVTEADYLQIVCPASNHVVSGSKPL